MNFTSGIIKTVICSSLDSFDVRGIDVGSMLFVSLKQDTAGSHWPWRLDWVRIIRAYHLLDV